MDDAVQSAFADMLDVSTDIEKAVLFAGDTVLASNMPEEVRLSVMAQAKELLRLAEEKAQEMGAPSVTQLAIETPNGYVFVVREPRDDGMTIIATGRRGSHVGLVLYDLRTCMRDVREEAASAEESTAEGRGPATGAGEA